MLRWPTRFPRARACASGPRTPPPRPWAPSPTRAGLVLRLPGPALRGRREAAAARPVPTHGFPGLPEECWARGARQSRVPFARSFSSSTRSRRTRGRALQSRATGAAVLRRGRGRAQAQEASTLGPIRPLMAESMARPNSHREASRDLTEEDNSLILGISSKVDAIGLEIIIGKGDLLLKEDCLEQQTHFSTENTLVQQRNVCSLNRRRAPC
ncbi:uncharacterized protein [Canis lupus baileyi]|uniref:uncharacterized protein n=1 Tax=Canis lupus baileyi TaxID=143281 RepID=UPI003B96E88B